MLMAADILLYDVDVVPVGEDQRQHLEYTREAATKFNNAFGNTLKEPKELILPGVGIVPGTDGAKMSKSYKNTIPLFGSKDDIAKAVMGIVTDSSGDTPVHVRAIHTLFRDEAFLSNLYEEKKGRYKDLKEALIEDIERTLAPMREKRASITDDDVRTILKDGAERAGVVARAKTAKIKEMIGVTI
jgi:tryptophanyl-tRNA synthetase